MVKIMVRLATIVIIAKIKNNPWFAKKKPRRPGRVND